MKKREVKSEYENDSLKSHSESHTTTDDPLVELFRAVAFITLGLWIILFISLTGVVVLKSVVNFLDSQEQGDV